jgi:hypothetical protein
MFQKIVFLAALMIDVCLFTSLPLPIVNLLLSYGIDKTDCNNAWSDDFWATYERNRIYDVFASCSLLFTRLWYTNEARTMMIYINSECITDNLRHRKNLHIVVLVVSFFYAIAVDCMVFAWTFDVLPICTSGNQLTRVLCDTIDMGLHNVFYLYGLNVVILLISASLVFYLIFYTHPT